MAERTPHITVKDLTMAYGDFVLMRELSYTVYRGDIFIIMGGSGCGKSTMMSVLIGLKKPATGRVLYGEVDFWGSPPETRDRIIRRADATDYPEDDWDAVIDVNLKAVFLLCQAFARAAAARCGD